MGLNIDTNGKTNSSCQYCQYYQCKKLFYTKIGRNPITVLVLPYLLNFGVGIQNWPTAECTVLVRAPRQSCVSSVCLTCGTCISIIIFIYLLLIVYYNWLLESNKITIKYKICSTILLISAFVSVIEKDGSCAMDNDATDLHGGVILSPINPSLASNRAQTHPTYKSEVLPSTFMYLLFFNQPFSLHPLSVSNSASWARHKIQNHITTFQDNKHAITNYGVQSSRSLLHCRREA